MRSFQRSGRNMALAGLAGAAVACAPAQPTGAPVAIPEIAGRTAGPPQTCVSIDSTTSLRVVDERTALYGGGNTVWVNHLKSQCPGADRMDILVAQPTGAQYCNGDQVRVLDPLTQIPGPVCVLGDFVPYRR